GTFFYLSLRSEVNQSFFCDDMWRSTNRRPDLGADLGQAGERSGATNNGLPLIRPAARGTTSNTRRSTSQTVMADCSTVRPTPESRGSRRSTFPTSLYFERSTWTATAISTWAAKDSDFRCA